MATQIKYFKDGKTSSPVVINFLLRMIDWAWDVLDRFETFLLNID